MIAIGGNCTAGSVRLVDGNATNEGRVEICLDGQWGTICTRFSSEDVADAVCGTLGYASTGMYNNYMYYINYSFINFYFYFFNNNNNYCFFKIIDILTRKCYYYVLRYCRILYCNYVIIIMCISISGATAYINSNGEYGMADGPIWLSSVECYNSDDTMLFDCGFSGDTSDCSHSNDLAVSCIVKGD